MRVGERENKARAREGGNHERNHCPLDDIGRTMRAGRGSKKGNWIGKNIQNLDAKIRWDCVLRTNFSVFYSKYESVE